MNEITLIELCKRSGSQNSINQLLAPQQTIRLDNVEEYRSYVVIVDEGIRFCMTVNSSIADSGSEYVILTDRKPTKQKLIEGAIKQKKWLKHPMMVEKTPEDVLQSWTDQFHFKEEQGDSNPGLRRPQLGALHAILGHLLAPNDIATIVLPTGTGKTETMLSALVAGKCSRLLVTVPTDALRNQLFEKFKTLGVLKNPQFGIMGDNALYPIVGMVNTSFQTADQLRDFVSQCNVVITTMQIIDYAPKEQQDVYVSAFSNVFVDEAHHIVASSWRTFADRFPKEKLIQFTATPFRNDGQRLDGKIIFNYSLRKAQEDGYYRKINFLPIREYDDSLADRKIAVRAIEKLKEDLSAKFKHIMMARCETRARAEEVFKIYAELFPELNPIILYSRHPDYKKNYEKILRRETKVIVCVNMLGEGFDLPELKIAAFHDIRKSLPITLQFAGRFTRTSRDAELGNASFVANVANLDVQQELDNLYEEDADWNVLLANANDNRVNNQEDYKKLLEGFREGVNATIPVSSIYPKFSVVVYKNYTNSWHPEDFYKGVRGYESFDFKTYDINDREKLLVAVMAEEQSVDGIKVKEVMTTTWRYIILFWDEKKNLLFINSSDNGSVYKDIAKNVIGEPGKEPELIRGIDVFRTFYNVKRTKLRNVGLKVFMGRDVRYRMLAGRDIENAISTIELHNSEKSFVVGDGFEDGERTSIGASYKGRIWSLTGNGDIMAFKRWCLEQGEKLTNNSIDGNQILKESLIPKTTSKIPDKAVPFCIDWDEMLWRELENYFSFNLLGTESFLFNTDIELQKKDPVVGNSVFFQVSNGKQTVRFKLELYVNTDNKTNQYSDFKIIKLTEGDAIISYGKNHVDLTKFFEDYPPAIYFSDGSCLCGNEYIELSSPPALYDREKFIAWNWAGVKIEKESQGIEPNIRKESVQYKVIQELLKGDYDIIYDDDNAGEMADVITLKHKDNTICVELYHLKFAEGGEVSSRVTNFYEVCGQAQKSSNWKYKEPEEMLNHLLRRETKKGKDGECSRIQKGSHDLMVKLLKMSKRKLPVKYSIYVVQPGVTKKTATDEILTLLGVTESFLKERTGIELKVITNE